VALMRVARVAAATLALLPMRVRVSDADAADAAWQLLVATAQGKLLQQLAKRYQGLADMAQTFFAPLVIDASWHSP
jgi:hypothetical protein